MLTVLALLPCDQRGAVPGAGAGAEGEHRGVAAVHLRRVVRQVPAPVPALPAPHLRKIFLIVKNLTSP